MLVCDSSNVLHASGVSLDGSSPAVSSLATGGGGNISDAQLCGLGGAAFSPEPAGSHTASINIP